MQRERLLEKLHAASRSAERRLKLRASLRAGSLMLPLPLIYALGALTFIKVQQPSGDAQRALLGVGLVFLLVFVGASLRPWVRRRERFSGALALDRHHALKDRVTNALTFAGEKERTPLMDAAIDDAENCVESLDPARAVPVRLPKDLLASFALAAAVYGVSLLEVRNTRIVIEPAPTHFEAMTLNPDDVDLLREWSNELQKGTEDPEVSRAVRQFNQLVEDIAERRLNRQQVFEKLEELEQSLNTANSADQAALDEGLESLARELQRSGSTKPVAEALEQKRLEDAKKALEELAKRLEEKPSKVNKAELERIRQALESASKQSAQRLENIERERRELEETRKRLLNKKKEGEKLSKGDQKKLEDNERRLKRLDRQKKSAEAASKEMSQLDKDLAKAAQELMKEMGTSSESLKDAAEDINRMAKKQLSNEEKEALKKQLEELRQLLRQQKKGGQKRDEALERFRQMAQGQGQGKKPGQGQNQGQGQGKGKGEGRMGLGLGQGQGQGQVPIPGGQESSSASQGDGSGESGQPGGGKEWGSGTTEDIAGDPSAIDGQTQDVSAAGIDSGEGEASVEVVFGAAERGFTGRGYKKVYTDYKTVAEEVIEKDEIPPGYKFYVRRYFQLIRPRD